MSYSDLSFHHSSKFNCNKYTSTFALKFVHVLFQAAVLSCAWRCFHVKQLCVSNAARAFVMFRYGSVDRNQTNLRSSCFIFCGWCIHTEIGQSQPYTISYPWSSYTAWARYHACPRTVCLQGRFAALTVCRRRPSSGAPGSLVWSLCESRQVLIKSESRSCSCISESHFGILWPGRHYFPAWKCNPDDKPTKQEIETGEHITSLVEVIKVRYQIEADIEQERLFLRPNLWKKKMQC